MLKDWDLNILHYEFFSPGWLWLLCLVPLFWIYSYLTWNRRAGEFQFSGTVQQQQQLDKKWDRFLRIGIQFLYGFIALLLILAMARPFNYNSAEDYSPETKKGIDIMIAMDISGSMLARDFLPNRIEASKKVAKEFIDSRKGDRIGLVAYEGEAYTVCPATLDYEILKAQIDRLESGLLDPGTAIGVGLGTAINRLQSDTLQTKVIILLTDGINMQGDVTPGDAALLAKKEHIKVYTIGVGTIGIAPSPEFTPFGIRYIEMPVEIDETVLKEIAETTGGRYFRATDEESLRLIYQEIDMLEKKDFAGIDYKLDTPVTPMAFLNLALLLGILVWTLQIFYFKTNG